MIAYQPIRIQGQTTVPGTRDAESRYQALKQSLLSRYTRPFTVLDIGAAQGYFGFRILEDFPESVVVMVDNVAGLPVLCCANNTRHAIVLRRALTLADLRMLSACEHFDVVLALNVLHHSTFQMRWKEAVDTVMTMGDNIVIETPVAGENVFGRAMIGPLLTYLQSLNGQLLCETPSHEREKLRPMYLWERNKPCLTQKFVDSIHTPRFSGITLIHSMFGMKEVEWEYKKEYRPWIHGINLWTYACMGGTYPTRPEVSRMIRDHGTPSVHHGDIRPWNFVFDGGAVHLIDTDDRKSKPESDAYGIGETLRLLNYERTRQIVHVQQLIGYTSPVRGVSRKMPHVRYGMPKNQTQIPAHQIKWQSQHRP